MITSSPSAPGEVTLFDPATRKSAVLTNVHAEQATWTLGETRVVRWPCPEGGTLEGLLTVTPRLRFFMTEKGYAMARRTHAVGLLISLASVNPARAKAFVAGDDAQRTADVADFSAMGATLKDLAADRFHIDGAYDKMLFRVSDPTFPLRLLPPYAHATEPCYYSMLYFASGL